MTPYTRRMVAAGLLAAALTTSGIYTHRADSAGPPNPTQMIAPGGQITSVLAETQRSGWPHVPTGSERLDVATIALYATTPANVRASNFCRFGVYLGKVRCTTKIGKARKTWTVRVFKDGSYRITHAPRPGE